MLIKLTTGKLAKIEWSTDKDHLEIKPLNDKQSFTHEEKEELERKIKSIVIRGVCLTP